MKYLALLALNVITLQSSPQVEQRYWVVPTRYVLQTHLPKSRPPVLSYGLISVHTALMLHLHLPLNTHWASLVWFVMNNIVV